MLSNRVDRTVLYHLYEITYMASQTRWTWVWVNSGRWWWTRRPGVLRFMGSQRVWHDWATELNWIWILAQNFKKNVNGKDLKTDTVIQSVERVRYPHSVLKSHLSLHKDLKTFEGKLLLPNPEEAVSAAEGAQRELRVKNTRKNLRTSESISEEGMVLGSVPLKLLPD